MQRRKKNMIYFTDTFKPFIICSSISLFPIENIMKVNGCSIVPRPAAMVTDLIL
jgi:hypothetical protein